MRTSDDGGKPVIEGHAAVFSRWSETLGGFFPFKERVKSGAFSRTIAESDIRALFNHNSDYVLGRNKAGTLELTEDERGLFVRIHPPDTQWARDLAVSISRGDISQMSFGFTVDKEAWSTDAEGVDTRELLEVTLFDVSPVTYPAYKDTDCGVRGYEAYQAEKRAKADAERQNSESLKERNRQLLRQRRRRLELLK
jgi:HK97 family phage prohead protease